MFSPAIIIAIDGYSSTGKSTFAKLLASRLGFIHIDTGALYRAVTLFAIRSGYISKDNTILCDELERALKTTSIYFKLSSTSGKSETYLNGENIEKEIRTLAVSDKVSYIAALPLVRNYVDNLLREMGKNKGVVMDGRDIGTAVFPEAELKIFMTADPLIRAQRRLDEMHQKGETANLEEVLQNLQKRDYIDEHRETAPLSRAADAILLDNSYLTIEEELDRILTYINENIH